MKKFLAVLMILFVSICAGCGNNPEPKPVAKEKQQIEIKKISQDKAMEMLAADPNAKLLDCRFPKDYEMRHIPGAIMSTTA